MLLLAASCAKEPVEQEPQAKQVPLNITINTKADDGSTPGKFDINTVRVLVFKNAAPSDPPMTRLLTCWSSTSITRSVSI